MQDTVRDSPAAETAKDKQSSRAFSDSDSATRTVYFIAGAIAVALVFWRLQFTTQAICCGDYDPYYHIRWSRLLWKECVADTFRPRSNGCR
jgi:asparagine N-glycosylation enzyme membrane subunit Stt3